MTAKIIHKTKEEIRKLLDDGRVYEFRPMRFRDLENVNEIEYKIRRKK